jgi:hypothetical protein
MKKSIFVFGLVFDLLISGLAQAAVMQYTCYEQGGELRVVTLTQNKFHDFKAGEKEPFTLRIYKEDGTKRVLIPGTVVVEDVTFTFTSQNGKYKFRLYLDEMDQSYLEVNGQDAGRFTCSPTQEESAV